MYHVLMGDGYIEAGQVHALQYIYACPLILSGRPSKNWQHSGVHQIKGGPLYVPTPYKASHWRDIVTNGLVSHHYTCPLLSYYHRIRQDGSLGTEDSYLPAV